MNDRKEYCIHEWETKDNYEVCSKCHKQRLALKKISEDLMQGQRSDGHGGLTNYTVRFTRNNYFYPEEWMLFIESIKDDYNKLLFNFLIKTGARIEEALHFKLQDIADIDRNAITLKVTKRKAKKQSEQDRGKPRTFEVDKRLVSDLIKYATEHHKESSDFIFLDTNMQELKETKKFAKIKKSVAYQLMKRHLKALNIQSESLSLHNIRKTHGMYLKCLGVPEGEICLRLGHNEETFRLHYGSPSIFNKPKDKQLMIKIVGAIYGL